MSKNKKQITESIANLEEKILFDSYALLNYHVNIYLKTDNDESKGMIKEVHLVDIHSDRKDPRLIINTKRGLKSVSVCNIIKIEEFSAPKRKFDWFFFVNWIKMLFSKKAFMLILFLSLFLNIQAKPEYFFVRQIHEELKCQNVEFSRIVIRQAILETGWFKSKVYRNKNNLFGFRTKNGYLTFDSWEDSIVYYKKWQKKHYTRFKEKTEDTCYYNFLRWVGYAEDELYITKLKSIRIKHIIYN
jgi:hypothetical protein